MPGWLSTGLDVGATVCGGFFLIHGAISLALGRSLIPRPFGRANPSGWEFGAQIILGVVLLLLEGSLVVDSSVRGPLAFAGLLGGCALFVINVVLLRGWAPSPRR